MNNYNGAVEQKYQDKATHLTRLDTARITLTHTTGGHLATQRLLELDADYSPWGFFLVKDSEE